MDHQWVTQFPGAITVCDREGIILEMNEAAVRMFQKQGGLGLVGTNVMDCHPEPAREKLKRLMERPEANVYTIEKKGRKRLIYQTPWFQRGQYAGFIELAIDIPDQMPHFVRQDP